MKKYLFLLYFCVGLFIGIFSMVISAKRNTNSKRIEIVEFRENINLDKYIILASPNADELSMIAKCSTDGINDQRFRDSVGLIDPRDVTLYRRIGSNDYVVSFRIWQSLDLYVAYFINSGDLAPMYKGVYSLA